MQLEIKSKQKLLCDDQKRQRERKRASVNSGSSRRINKNATLMQRVLVNDIKIM